MTGVREVMCAMFVIGVSARIRAGENVRWEST